MIEYLIKLLKINEVEILSSTDFLIKALFLAILVGAILMVTAESILLSCFSLIFIFICGMGISISLNLWFIGLLILIIYIGAIATLFLFIILMIDLYTKIQQENNIEKLITIFMNIILIFLIFCVNYDYIFTYDETVAIEAKTYEEFFQIERRTSTNAQILHLFNDENLTRTPSVAQVSINELVPEQQKTISNSINLDGNDITVLGNLLYTHFAIILILCGSSLLIAIIGVLITAEGLAKWDFATSKTSLTTSIGHVSERKQDSFHQILKMYRTPLKKEKNMSDNNEGSKEKKSKIETIKTWFKNRSIKEKNKTSDNLSDLKGKAYLTIAPMIVSYNWNASAACYEDKITINLFVTLLLLIFLSVLIVISIDFEKGTGRYSDKDGCVINLTSTNGDIFVIKNKNNIQAFSDETEIDKNTAFKEFMPFFTGLKTGIYYNVNNSVTYKIKIVILASVLMMVGLYGFLESFGELVMYGTFYYVPLEFVFNFRNIAIAFFIWVWALCFFVFTVKSRNYVKKSELLLFWIILWTMFLAMCSNDIFSVIILLESITFCLYILASLQDSNWSRLKNELASIYYARFGLLASCLFIFGCSLLYLSLGQWKLSEIAGEINLLYENNLNFFTNKLDWDTATAQDQGTEAATEKAFYVKQTTVTDNVNGAQIKSMGVTSTYLGMQLGLVFILLSFLFKFSLVPVHLWIVMVYENIRFDILGFFVVFTKQVFFLFFWKNFTL